MKFPFHFPISDRLIAKRVAVAFVRNEFNTEKAVRELCPEVGKWRDIGARLLSEPGVRHEIGILMDRIEKKENRAEAFLKKMWEWLEPDPPQPINGIVVIDKAVTERQLTAARILAKGYIREKGPTEKDSPAPMVIEGLGDGINNLTGETPVVQETDPKKVV